MDKEIRNLIILTVIVFVLMLASTYMLHNMPKILGSPREEVYEQGGNYLLVIVPILAMIFIFLITLIAGKYVIIRKREKKRQEKDNIYKVTNSY